MAGWKLRKDKTPAEVPGPDSETAVAEIAAAETAAPAAEPTTPTFVQEYSEDAPLAVTPGLPDFDSDTDFSFTDSGFDTSPILSEQEPAEYKPTDYEAVEYKSLDYDSFENGAIALGEEPLTLVDYTEPLFVYPAAAEDLTPEPPVLALSEAEDPAPTAFELLPPAAPDPLPTPSADDFLQRLRTGHGLPFEPVPVSAPTPVNGFSTPVISDFGSGIPTVAPFVLDTPAPTAPPAAAPQLVVRIGRLSATYALTKDVTTIGRPDSTLHYYPDIEIEMDDAVSRRHAEVVSRGGVFCLVDTGSTNGTMLNGETLPPHEERLLAHGDRIRVGDRTEIIFE